MSLLWEAAHAPLLVTLWGFSVDLVYKAAHARLRVVGGLFVKPWTPRIRGCVKSALLTPRIRGRVESLLWTPRIRGCVKMVRCGLRIRSRPCCAVCFESVGDLGRRCGNALRLLHHFHVCVCCIRLLQITR